MAGVSTGGAKAGRRTVDQEVNMVPFIDLLMVTISFLLVTAVWTSMARVPTTPRAPNERGKEIMKEEPTALRVRVDADKNVALQWQKGQKVEDVATVPLEGLEAAVHKAWASGRVQDGAVPATAILQVAPKLRLYEITRAMDGIRAPKRKDGQSAFDVTFSTS
ncbi:MAG: biopolymer transporter ExbD [Deltaproteobacteria bacterium]|nr:biopolymer transporter ExbD [Deltaproteobacteria bacterium]